MTRRPQLEQDFAQWLRRLGLQIRTLRLAGGWTQPQAAERCGLDYKQYQAIEYGRARLTAHTLFVLAHGFGVDPAALLPAPTNSAAAKHPEPTSQPAPHPWPGLQAVGWRICPAGQRPPPRHAVPVYDLQAAAGPGDDTTNQPSVVAWALPPEGRRKTAAGYFLAQAHGTSMEPLVQDGAWCLFHQPVTTPVLGRVVLVRTDPTALGDAGLFQLKRVGALELDEHGSGVRVRLDSVNRTQPPIEVRAASEQEFQALGELVEVLVDR